MKRFALAAAVGVGLLVLAGAIALSSAPPVASPPMASPPMASPAPGRVAVPAPIDDIRVVIRESSPPQVSLTIRAGLPSGCAERGSYSVGRSGDTFIVTVLNTMPAGNPVCTMIYGMYDVTVDLGSQFTAGVTYTVRVNDRTTTFRT